MSKLKYEYWVYTPAAGMVRRRVVAGTFGSCRVLFVLSLDPNGADNLADCPAISYTHHKGLGYFAHGAAWKAQASSLNGLRAAVRDCLAHAEAGGTEISVRYEA